MEFYIGHEKGNPLKAFYYRPVKVTTNTLIAKILGEFKVDFSKEYQFYFTLDGINFSFIGKPVRSERKNEVTFLVKESRIELRRYPRIRVEDPNIVVVSSTLTGYLIDISLGGCKVKFEGEITPSYYKSNPIKRLTFEIPNYRPISFPARIVNVQLNENSVSYAFNSKDEKVLKLYNAVINYLRLREMEY